jgi:hypothetical protein
MEQFGADDGSPLSRRRLFLAAAAVTAAAAGIESRGAVAEAVPAAGDFDLALYGIDGTNNVATAAANSDILEAVLAEAGQIRGKSAFGSTVRLPHGTFRIARAIRIPTGVTLRGAGPSASIILPTADFKDECLVSNAAVNQEFFFLESLGLNGGQGFAVNLKAVVLLDTVYVNSAVRDVVVTRGSENGILVRCTGAGSCGPLNFDNVWITRCGDHNVVVKAPVTRTSWRALCSERPGPGKAAVYLANPDAATNGDHDFTGVYTEAASYSFLIENTCGVSIRTVRGGPVRIVGRPQVDGFGSTHISLDSLTVYPPGVAIFDEPRGVVVPGPRVSRYETNPTVVPAPPVAGRASAASSAPAPRAKSGSRHKPTRPRKRRPPPHHG